jgi:hypothetical protein
MEVDYLKKRFVIKEPVSIKRIIEEFSYLGLDEWVVVGISDDSYHYGIASVDEWEVTVAF